LALLIYTRDRDANAAVIVVGGPSPIVKISPSNSLTALAPVPDHDTLTAAAHNTRLSDFMMRRGVNRCRLLCKAIGAASGICRATCPIRQGQKAAIGFN
jgi:hypothetical protein